MRRKTRLPLLLLVLLCPGSGLGDEERLPFGDPYYPEAVWRYLEEEAPEIVRAWDSLDQGARVRAAERVRETAEEWNAALLRRRFELISLCGKYEYHAGSDRWWDPISERAQPSCDLRAVTEIRDQEITRLERWFRDPEGRPDFLRDQKRSALSLLINLDSGRLTEEDLRWARENLSPEQLGRVRAARDVRRRGEALPSGIRSIFPAGFDARRAAGSLLAASLDEGTARATFDRARPGRGVPLGPGPAADVERRMEALALEEEGERRFGRAWNEAALGRLRSYRDPVSAEILSGLGGRLPEVRIGRFREDSPLVATYTRGTAIIELSDRRVAESMRHAIARDRSLGRGGCSEALEAHERTGDPMRLASCLSTSPGLLSAVLDDFEPTQVHELVHAVQDRRFRTSETLGAPRANLKPIEKEAFIQSMTWLSHHPEARVFASDSPGARAARADYLAYYSDPDAFLRDVDSRYHASPDLAEVRRGHEASIQAARRGEAAPGRGLERLEAGREPLRRMEAYYSEFFPRAEEDWRRRSAAALLAVGRSSPDPVERVEALAAARTRLPPGRVDAELDRASRAASGQILGSPDDEASESLAHGNSLLRVERALRASGRALPPDLGRARNSIYRRNLRTILDLLRQASLPVRLRRIAAEEGQEYARALGDHAAVGELERYRTAYGGN